MSEIIIGCDPDSKAHGIAIYEDGVLIHLKSMPILELMELMQEYVYNDDVDSIVAHIENVKVNSSSGFHYKKKDSQAVKAKKSENVGMCKQAQSEVERLFDYFGIEVVHHKISGAWKKGDMQKNQFKLATKWKGRSNEDTRSAAYFGYLGLK